MLKKHFYSHNKRVSVPAHLFFILLISLPQMGLSLAHTGAPKADINTAYSKILNLQLDEGRALLEATSDSAEELPLKLYVANLADVLELLLTEDKILYEELKQQEKNRLKQLEQASEDNPYKKFCEAEIKLQWAFVKLRFGDELSAVWNFRQAFHIITANEKTRPDFIPNKKTSGLLNILFGAVPEKYQWLLSFLGLEGSTNNGLDQLNDLANSSHLLAPEGKITLALIHVYLLGKPDEAVSTFNSTAEKEPESKLIQYLYALMLVKTGSGEAALKVLNQLDNFSGDYLPLATKHYLQGEIYLQKGEYYEAIDKYQTFLNTCKGDGFIKDSYYKIFLAHWLKGNKAQADSFFAKAKIKGNTSAEADKNADKQLSSERYPHKNLMKIRLATDGGYFDIATALINKETEKTLSTPKEKVEYIYRQGRLLDKMAQIEKAIVFYEKTIEKAGDAEWYFAPNAALQLGYIYRTKGNTLKARAYFKKAMSYKNHSYKNSIDHKAELALQHLGEN